MKTILWGVRGSISTHSGHTTRYGGNTTCIENVLDSGYRVIFDAGTGLRHLGAVLMDSSLGPVRKACTIFLSHGHWDHIVGLPFFAPLYDPEWEITLCGPADMCGVSLEHLITNLFNPATFPLSWEKLPRHPRLVPLRPGETLAVDTALLRTYACNHGVGGKGALSCALEGKGMRIFYSGDHELGETIREDDPVLMGMRNSDVAIVDAQYTLGDYEFKQGWGHSAFEQWPQLALEYNVGRLLLSHFDPDYTDAMLDMVGEKIYREFPEAAEVVVLAHEGMEVNARRVRAKDEFAFPHTENCHNCHFSRELFEYSDESMIFDSLLTEARRQTHADAGTIYLRDGDTLVFSYTQNETLFSRSQAARQQYLKATLPIDNASIAGYVAGNCKSLNIEDVYCLPDDVTYHFNKAFDQASGYRTRSMCVTPLTSLEGDIVGVLQLINCKVDGEVSAFSPLLLQQIESLAGMGAQAIERAHKVRDMILRMLRTAALRDPTETAGHVMRVGAIAAEIYHRWAEKKKVESHKLLSFKANIRLAAMLHDVGKVGISDAILKKRGRLTPRERHEMEKHCALGGSLFNNSTWELDILAREIALHHHQRWDGTGYTGSFADPPRAGKEIPLGARITAIADVFDALVSRRCYKDPWPVHEAMQAINEGSGTLFEPELVDVFMEIQDTVMAIRERYPES